MSNQIMFFPHDVNASGDEKFIDLLRDYGWKGYGIYWGIIEKLHKNNNLLSRNYDGIAYEMRENSETIKNIVEKYQLFRLKTEKFSSDRVSRNLKKIKEKSQKAKKSADKRWNDGNAFA